MNAIAEPHGPCIDQMRVLFRDITTRLLRLRTSPAPSSWLCEFHLCSPLQVAATFRNVVSPTKDSPEGAHRGCGCCRHGLCQPALAASGPLLCHSGGSNGPCRWTGILDPHRQGDAWSQLAEPGRAGWLAVSPSSRSHRHGTERSSVFRHTIHFMRSQGFDVTPVDLQVSFGKDSTFWTNVFPTALLAEHQSEIARFHRVLRIMKYLTPVFTLMPVSLALKLFRFSPSFVNLLILPSLALFLGTGNATPSVPAIAMVVLFLSKTVGMWHQSPPDRKSLVSTLPSMIVFPELSAFYNTWADSLKYAGVTIRTSTVVIEILQRSSKHGVRVFLRQPDGTSVEHYDQLVLAVLADTANQLLGHTITWRERIVLGGARFSDDVTVTHHDDAYMAAHYTPAFDPVQTAPDHDTTASKQRIQAGKTQFRPMYYVLPYAVDPSKIELSFDCTHYQAQFPRSEDSPAMTHVYQSIFLNRARDSALWPKDTIDARTVIREDWWHQLCHTWTHYVRVVPWMWLLNNCRNATLFSGSWTVVNAHETAIVSGLAAAWRLGADYVPELEEDRVARLHKRPPDFIQASHLSQAVQIAVNSWSYLYMHISVHTSLGHDFSVERIK